MSNSGIGAAVPRREDDRFLRGLGRYIADVRLPRMLDAAFLRSDVAHASITIEKPNSEYLFSADDLANVDPIRAVSSLDGFKASDYPILATRKVRFVGEPIAFAVADNRAKAEDRLESITVAFEPLPTIASIADARGGTNAKVHDDWPDNINLALEFGETFELTDAPVVVRREYKTARQCMAPIESRGVVADWDPGREFLTVYSSTQIPHLIRRSLADCLGLRQQQVRVIAPDVGGGFGLKLILQPEEVAVCWASMTLRRPVRWIEDRKEHLTAGVNCREHEYKVTAYANNDGRILGIDVEIDVDAGAYSIWPFTSCFEAAQAGASFPGPYKIANYHARTATVVTNKPPIQPYRGVSRTGICFAMELTIDAVARAVGREPCEVRKLNLVQASDMPFTNVMGKEFDSGNYPDAVQTAMNMIDLHAVRQRQRDGEKDGRLIGVGFSTYCEQSAHGTRVFAGVGIPIVPGHEQARVRLAPDGTIEIMTGLQSHGQSLETTLAQMASEVLDVPLERITVIHGDTGETPFSTGTYASRSIVWGGGAVHAGSSILAQRLITIGAALLDADPKDVSLSDGAIKSAERSLSFSDLASVWYDAPEELPTALTSEPLEAIGTYKPSSDHGAFSYATHAAVVAVDPELGHVEILDYVIADDCGRRVNPLVVEGQIIGGTAQGIGTALYEETPYNSDGQPLAPNLTSYLLPGATEVPNIRIATTETLSPNTINGIKGVGEGGAVAPPAAITNAINDALANIGVEMTDCPVTPRRLFEAINRSERQAP